MTDARPRPEPHALSAASTSVAPEWLSAMLRNYAEQDDALTEGRAVVVSLPNDPLTFLVLQRGGNHLMIQVNPCELVVR